MSISNESVDLHYLSIIFPDSTILKDNTLFKKAARKLAEQYSTFF